MHIPRFPALPRVGLAVQLYAFWAHSGALLADIPLAVVARTYLCPAHLRFLSCLSADKTRFIEDIPARATSSTLKELSL